MYPNLLASILIALIALTIIGSILNAQKLAKAAAVLLVVEAATACILWLLMGLSPVPHWFAKWIAMLVQVVQRVAR
jgi:hypothetical protein